MPFSGPWLRQAKSDLAAARRLSLDNAPELYCQIAAKCQQVVEKSVKAIAAELTERRLVTITIAFDHRIDQYIVAILRTPDTRKKRVPDYIKQSLRRNLQDVKEIMSLAPHRPVDIARLPKNTEYPFHDAQGVLMAPSDADVFKQADADRYLKLASVIYHRAYTLIAIAESEP